MAKSPTADEIGHEIISTTNYTGDLLFLLELVRPILTAHYPQDVTREQFEAMREAPAYSNLSICSKCGKICCPHTGARLCDTCKQKLEPSTPPVTEMEQAVQVLNEKRYSNIDNWRVNYDCAEGGIAFERDIYEYDAIAIANSLLLTDRVAELEREAHFDKGYIKQADDTLALIVKEYVGEHQHDECGIICKINEVEGALAAAVERERALDLQLGNFRAALTDAIKGRDAALARAQAAEREVGMLRGREQLAIEMCASATEPKLEARRLAAERETLVKGLRAARPLLKGGAGYVHEIADALALIDKEKP